MVKELMDKKSLVKTGDNYVWSQEYKAELEQVDFDKNKRNLQGNVNMSKAKLKTLDIRKSIEQLKISLKNEYNINKEALKNFDQYIEDSIETIKIKVSGEKNNMRMFIDNYEEVVKQAIVDEKKKLMLEQKQWKDTLKDQEEKLKIYTDLEDDEIRSLSSIKTQEASVTDETKTE